MLEEQAGVEEDVAKAKKNFRAQVEGLCHPEEVEAAEESAPIPGLKEQPLGAIRSRR